MSFTILATFNTMTRSKCCSCGESIRHSETVRQGQRFNGKKFVRIAGETYCNGCSSVAVLNVNPDAEVEHDPRGDDIESQIELAHALAKDLRADDAENRTERMREAYPAYSDKSNFWDDLNNGYI